MTLSIMGGKSMGIYTQGNRSANVACMIVLSLILDSNTDKIVKPKYMGKVGCKSVVRHLILDLHLEVTQSLKALFLSFSSERTNFD